MPGVVGRDFQKKVVWAYICPSSIQGLIFIFIYIFMLYTVINFLTAIKFHTLN